MHLLILNWRDPVHPLAGGAEISLFEHAKYWKKKGASVTWFASSFLNSKKEEEINGVKILRSGSQYSVHFLAFLYYLLGKFGKPDIVIDSFHFLPFFTPLYLRKAKIIGLMNEVAGRVWFSNIFFPLSLIGFLIEPFFLIFYKKNQFITSSESTREELVKLWIPLSNIHMVYHGLTVKKIGMEIVKEKDPTIIFLGRVSRDKGIKDALEAFKELNNRIKNLKFWIVGREEKEGYLKGLMQNTNLNQDSGQVKYFYYVDEYKKFELLKKSWILVHPSKKEGWGLTVIEAASQGTPTVGYNTEGLRDSILHEKTGILSSPNSKSLASEISRLISDKKLYNKLSTNAKDWSRKFDWEKSNIESWDVIVNK